MTDWLGHLFGYFHQEWRADFKSPEDVVKFIIDNENDETVRNVIYSLDRLIEDGVTDGYLQSNHFNAHSFRGAKSDLEVLIQIRSYF